MQVIGKPKHAIKTAVPEALALVDLAGKENRLPHELSGGEEQRVAIARAMVNRPELLLADEPTGNLDPDTSLGIMRLLDRINRQGTTVVMATHDADIVNQMRKRVIELHGGHVIREQWRLRGGELTMKLRFILSEVGKGLARNRAMSVAVIIVTYVSLLFVGVAGLSQMQVMQMKSQWYDKIEVSIYMCATDDATPSCNATEATEAQISAVRDKLNSTEMSQYVKNVFEESKEEAYENYLKLYGDSTISEWTTVDMMPVSFRVKLVDPEQYSIIKEEFSGAAGVSQVKDQREIIEPLFNVIDAARLMALGLGGVMIIAAILLISTTIRLSAMSRETETQIMRYVGASNLFIQAPFMIEGALAAIAGAILAVGTLFAGVHFLVQGWLAPSFSWTSFIGATHVWIMTPILILAAVALALIASAVSLAKYTKV